MTGINCSTTTGSAWYTITITTVDNDVDAEEDLRLVHRFFWSVDGETHTYSPLGPLNFSLTIVDDDTAETEVTPTTVTVAENGDTATYTVVLKTEPTSTVTVTPSSSDMTTASVSEPLTIRPSDWDSRLETTTPKTVTVTGVDDNLDNDVSRTAIISHTMSGGGYDDVAIEDVTATVTDDDEPGIVVVEKAEDLEDEDEEPGSVQIKVAENGGEATYLVKLTLQPTGNVRVSPSSTEPTAAQVAFASRLLTFTPEGWNTFQTVTVIGENDDINNEGGQRSASIGHTATGSGFEEAELVTVSVIVMDDDERGVTVSATALTLRETEDPDTSGEENEGSYTVVLTSQPTGNVTVTPSSGATSVATVEPDTLTLVFTPTNWKTAQTVEVRAKDDDVAGNRRSTTITHTVRSADENYNEFSAASVGVTVVDDDDTRGVTVSPTMLEMDEGEAKSYTVALLSQPTGDVTVTVRPGSGADSVATVSPLLLTFNSANWDEEQTVTVIGENDDIDNEGDQRSASIDHRVGGADYGSNNVSASSVVVTVRDINTRGVSVSPTVLRLLESDLGESENEGSYTVVLDSKPSGNVSIEVTLGLSSYVDVITSLLVEVSSDEVAMVQPATLTFTPTNWETAQTVTVTAVDNAIDEAVERRRATITHKVDGADYDGFSAASVEVEVTDDDVAGVTVSATVLSVNEADDTTTTATKENEGSYTVVLTSEPTGTVSIEVAGDTAVATVQPATLTFTSSDWNDPQTVRVTAKDDAIDNANNRRSATITHTVSGADYGSVSASSVVVTVEDDDSRGVTVSPTVLSVSEANDPGTSAKDNEGSYTVVLTSQPTGNVTVTPSSGATSVATVEPDTLTFTSVNWNEKQTVTVTGVDDVIDNPNNRRSAIIDHGVSGADYSDFIADSVTVTVTDNDAAPTSISLSANPASVAEGDGATTVRVTASVGGATTFGEAVTVTVNVGETTDSATAGSDYATVTAFPLTIPSGSATGSATFSLSPTDDRLDEEDETITVTGSASSITVTGATLTIRDNDSRGVTVSKTTLSVNEANDPLTSSKENEGSYTVVLTSQPTGTVTVTPVSGATGVATVEPATLTFTVENWETAQTVKVTAVDDTINNAGDQRSATVTHTVSGADYGNNNVSAGSVVVTVTDDDAAPTSISLSASPDTVAENAGSTTVRVTASVGGASTFGEDVTVTVNVGQTADTAAAGRDYDTVTAFPITISSGSATGSATFTLSPIDDSLDEPDETITVTGSVTNITVTDATITITDNDAPPGSVSLSVSPDTVAEDASPTTVTVTVTAAVEGASTFGEDVTMTVSVGRTTDSATAGSDYATVTAFPLTIPSGSATGSATFTLSPTDDDLDEDDETVTVSGTVTNITVTDATLTIRDNDLASSEVNLTVSPDRVSERIGTVEITVTAKLNNDTRSVATLVTVDVGSGTADEGTDFATVDDFIITIPADTLSGTATFSLTLMDDGAEETDETVAVDGSTTVSGLSVTGTTVTITNDDTAPTVAITVDDHLLGIDETATVTVAFSEPVSGFTAEDLTASDGTLSDFSGNDGSSVYTATLSPPANGSGTITLNVAANVAQDGAGNGNEAAEPVTVAYDTIAPAVVVTVDDTLLGIGETATVTVTFSEPVSGFTAEDLTASDGTLSDFSGNDGDSVYRFNLSPPANGSGTITLTVAANVAEDKAGNGNEAAEPVTVAYDTIAPTVLITVDDHNLGVGETATVTVTFSEPVSGFTAEELTASDGILSDFSGSDGDSVYTATLIPPAYGSGTITLNVAANVAEDKAGNGNEAAEPVTVTYDTISSLLYRIATQFLARLGRTIGAQVLESIDNRLQKPAAGNQVVVGGQQFGRFEDLFMDDRFFNVLKTGDLLSDTSFHLSTGNGNAELEMNGDWALWGDVARTHTTGEDNGLSMTLDALTTTVGLDRQHDRWLWGIGLSHSEAWGRFVDTSAAAHSGGEDLKGKAAASVTALHPYVSIQPHDNLELFGMAGYGWGSMSLDPQPDSAKDYASALRMYMVGVGGRGFLSSAAGRSLYGKGDVLLVRTEAEKEIGGKPVAAEALRARVALETVVEEQLREGVARSLTFESGLRYDAGDAEEGFGVELGAAWSYNNTERDLKLSLRAHGLLTHQEGLAFQDLGVSGSLHYGGVDQLGLRLSLSPSWGNPDSGVDRLWNDQTWRNFITNDDAATDDRRTGQMEGEIGYGFAVLAGEGVLTPYAGMTWSENGWDWQLGSRLHLDPALNFDLSLSRKERPSQPGDDYEILFSVETAW